MADELERCLTRVDQLATENERLRTALTELLGSLKPIWMRGHPPSGEENEAVNEAIRAASAALLPEKDQA
jgi:hypothetical protein